ncbi:MAG: ADP-ribosylglycohydrolase family protein, partial [Anaerolinea sp.]|nr:ADP-ribosylglycohydrolase family protein [Anaerolinea sp.]
MSADQAEAILFGLALGDALGRPTEFLDSASIFKNYGAQGILEPPDPALFTDDTQMTLALIEGLLDAGVRSDLDRRMDAVGRRFVGWLNSSDNNRAPGMTCMRAVSRLDQGVSWRESGRNTSKGCGSAMRVAGIGYLYQDDAVALIETARASSSITHGHPCAAAAAVAAAYAVKLALDGTPVATFIRRIAEVTAEISDEFVQALRRVGHVGGWADEIAAMRHIGQGWIAEEAVALALYCVLRYPDDYAACVRRAANYEGDSDSIACIAGGIMGAR